MIELETKEHSDSDIIKKWEQRSEVAQRGNGWACDKCGHIDKNWEAKCSNCGDFDSYVWKRVSGGVEINVPSVLEGV